jgi:hypothetical protein
MEITSEQQYSVRIRTLAIGFLVLQAVGLILWWATLLLVPDARQPFLAPNAPDSTLLAFIVADFTFIVAGSLLAAYGLARRRPWAWIVLCIHTGAVVYAALYALALPFFSGGGWLGALLMTPSLIVLPVLVWLLRPNDQT